MKYVIGNHKVNFGKEETLNFVNNFVPKCNNTEVVICPSYINIPYYQDINYKLGSQNIKSFESNSMTGEISAYQLTSYGVSYVIIGHSERRDNLEETNEVVYEKLVMALKHGLKPILCIGESLEERQNKTYLEVLIRELEESLKDINPAEVIIAYEPIWAIGTGLIPSNEDISEVINVIKRKVPSPLLYGGSVNSKNIKELELIARLDGYLIGGSSLKIDEMLEIIKVVDSGE